jgi:signal transduction histidine kinase
LQEPQLTGKNNKKYIKIIEKSGNRMLNIINDIINISKVESGQIEVLKLKLIMTYYNTYFNSLKMKQNERIQLSLKKKLHANENLLKPIKKNYMH